MSAPCSLFGACTCGSCNVPAPATPMSVANIPGLSSLRYRIGTFSTFRQAMLDYVSLNLVSNPSPADPSTVFTLTSRSSDDYGVAMLELWAYVCDVLTFYQQAIANEAYLRTATQDASVARLAALLGYKPAPSVAASAFLAFLTTKGATASIPAGLQTQSVPGPGQKPVIFEVTNPLVATAVNNQPQLLGPPVTIALEQSGVLLEDDPTSPLATGARLLFFDVSTGFVSQQQVTSVTPQAIGKLVTWRGRLPSSESTAATRQVFRLGRAFRAFGANAPATYITANVASDGTTTWTSNNTTYGLDNGTPSSSPLWLDNVYTGLGVGSQMLIQYSDGSSVSLVSGAIAAASNGTQTVGPVTGSATGVTLNSGSLGTGADLRDVTAYELLGNALVFATTGFDAATSPTYAVGAQSIYVLDASGIAAGTQLILSSQNANGPFGDAVAAAETPSAIMDGDVILGYSVLLDQALTNAYDVAATTLYANVAPATQGKSQPMETIGNGDASQQWQEFSLKGKPVTYVQNAAAERGAASTLQVFVNSVEWTETDSFYAHGPTDTVFVTRVGDDGTWYVRFGDGITGQRLPTGNRNVTALYRTDAGSNGDVAVDAISVILKSLPGLQSVINPLPAVGGGDGETIDRLRENAPVSVLTLNRAVSLRDYEALALTYADGSITKARASWTDLNDRRGVSLTAAAAGGQPLGQLAQPLRDYLDQHRDPNVPLAITDVTEVFIVFRAVVHVQDGHLLSVVTAAANAAIGITGDTGYLSYARLEIGESIYQSRLLTALQDVPGVEWVELKEFSAPYSSGNLGFSLENRYAMWHLPPGLFHIGGTMLDAVYISPQQIAQPSLTGSPTDISVDLTYSGGVNDLH